MVEGDYEERVMEEYIEWNQGLHRAVVLNKKITKNDKFKHVTISFWINLVYVYVNLNFKRLWVEFLRRLMSR